MNRRILVVLCVLGFAVGATHLRAQSSSPYPTPDLNPEGDTGAYVKAQVTTGGSYDIHSGNATRTVTDLQVPNALGMYKLDFTRYWNSVHPEETNMDAEWPQDFGASGWSHSWRWTAVYGEELPDMEPPNAPPFNWITSITINFPDGHATKFKISRTNGGPVVDARCGPPYSNAGETDWPMPAPHVHDRIDHMAYDGSEFWLSRADGGSVHFVGVHQENVGHAWWYYEAKEISMHTVSRLI